MNIDDDVLVKMAEEHRLNGIKPDLFKGQAKAFQECVRFLEGVSPSGVDGYSSYYVKHLVEEHSAQIDSVSLIKKNVGWIYEGTLILAAIHLRFQWDQGGKGVTAILYLDKTSLRDRDEELTEEYHRRKFELTYHKSRAV